MKLLWNPLPRAVNALCMVLAVLFAVSAAGCSFVSPQETATETVLSEDTGEDLAAETSREDPEQNGRFSPEEYVAEVSELTGKDVLFWYKIGFNTVYLYFTPIDPAAKEFSVYRYADYSMVINRKGEGFGELKFTLPDDIAFDTAEPVWAGGGGGSGDCQFIVRLASASAVTYISYNNFHRTDDLLDFAYAGEVSEDLLIYLAADDPEKFPDVAYLPHRSVLQEQAVFYDTFAKQETTLADWLEKTEFAVSKYSVIDLDGDGDSETVLWLTRAANEYVGFLILHSAGEKIYAHLLYYRQFYELKEDGTFSFSAGASDHGIGRIDFDGETYAITEIAYCASDTDQSVTYFIEDRSVPKDDFTAYESAQEQKPNAVWYENKYNT